ncbi:MAG: hypothetical protein CEE43_18865 [Promethearchaeota archaeon Loki_b32]|nr:MAG: hypothetical protein CEE43_18865 [Candidatus Lokiarchaeota archaeon Loki_b32]
MEFEERLTVIFLEFIKQSIDFKHFIDDITKQIEIQRKDGIWSDLFNSIIKNQNSLFSKIVHIYSITIFETFSREFFDELNKEKNLSKKRFKTTPSKILKFFESNFQINLENEFKLWEDLRENICRRNVIAHNLGKIDQHYIDCMNYPNSVLIDKMIGTDLEHNLLYIKKSNDTVGKYIAFTFKKIAEFYNFIDIESTVRSIAENDYFDDVNPNFLDDVEI